MSVSVSAISAITKRNFIPKLADNVIVSNALLFFMKKNGMLKTLDGGDQIYQPVRYARFNSRGNYSGGETLNTDANQKKTALVFDWKQKYVNISITGLDELKNSGASKVIDHVKSEVMAAQEDIIDLFGTGLYSSGTDSKDITGVGVFLSTSNSYGGISQSDESWLQAQVDSTTTTLTLAAMQSSYEAASQPPKERPNLITTTETLFNSYWSLLQPQQRFSDSSSADAGFKNLLFNGAPVLEDSYASSNSMYFFNLKHLMLYSHSKRNFPGDLQDFDQVIQQDVKVAKLLWAGELVCDSPRLQAIMNAVTS